jgi:hypothetical protein
VLAVIIELFATFLILSFFFIIAGLIFKIPFLHLAGFSIMFVLAALLVFGAGGTGIQYVTGATVTDVNTSSQVVTNVYSANNDVLVGSIHISHLIGVVVGFISIGGFVWTFIDMNGGK